MSSNRGSRVKFNQKNRGFPSSNRGCVPKQGFSESQHYTEPQQFNHPPRGGRGRPVFHNVQQQDYPEYVPFDQRNQFDFQHAGGNFSYEYDEHSVPNRGRSFNQRFSGRHHQRANFPQNQFTQGFTMGHSPAFVQVRNSGHQQQISPQKEKYKSRDYYSSVPNFNSGSYEGSQNVMPAKNVRPESSGVTFNKKSPFNASKSFANNTRGNYQKNLDQHQYFRALNQSNNYERLNNIPQTFGTASNRISEVTHNVPCAGSPFKWKKGPAKKHKVPNQSKSSIEASANKPAQKSKSKNRAKAHHWKQQYVWKKPQKTVANNLQIFARVNSLETALDDSEKSEDESISVMSCSSFGSNSEMLSSEQKSDEDDVDSNDSSVDSNNSVTYSVPQNESFEIVDAENQDFEVIDLTKENLERFRNSSCQNLRFQASVLPESFVSVFWDIENCPVPKMKSAIDIIKKIRDTFYDGRTEAEFIVACDTRRLPQIVEKELNEALVSIVHASSENKNAADVKLQSFLQRFQYQYRLKNSAIVLVSGDSDFSVILYEMHYKHHVYINLICNNMARKALKEAAHRWVLYEQFISSLPDRSKDEDLLHVLVIHYEVPHKIKLQAIKSCLSSRIKSVNGKVKVFQNKAELTFSNESACKKACQLFENFKLFGHDINLQCEVRKLKDSSIIDQEKYSMNIDEKNDDQSFFLKENYMKHKHSNKQKELEMSSNNKLSKHHAKSTETVCHEATLYVYVPMKFGDILYWNREFQALLKTTEFSLLWYGEGPSGYFLVGFKSLSKARKAKNVLVKNQNNDDMAPRFFKLLKTEADLSKSDEMTQDLQSIAQQEINDRLQWLEKKKNSCLDVVTNRMSALKASKKKIKDEKDLLAIDDKLNELNEQKIVFCNFSDATFKKIKELPFSESIKSDLDEIMKDYSRECSCFTLALPVYAKKNFLMKKIKSHQVILLQAETGSGKSTQLTQYLWREGFGKNGLIVCTQPRKIAAVTIAKHVCSQVGCNIGNIVGYQVGLNAKKSDNTKILYVTDFIMLKMCKNDQNLKDISCIIIDEAHERSIYTDLLLGMVKKCLPLRSDLKVIVTSATVDVSVFRTYFNLKEEAVLKIGGRKFPIEDIWLDTSVKLGWDYLGKAIDVVSGILEDEAGDVLVFLPTPAETEKAFQTFYYCIQNKNYKIKPVVYSLHGKLNMQDQQKVFDKTPKDSRKIVFATNCAETSVTIPGVRYVVDSGMVKEAHYDAVRNLNILTVDFVSKSSAEQRRGRAGRTQSGKCFRLYSIQNYENDMKPNMTPEILRINLGQALLRLMELGVKNPLEFDFVESPPSEALMAAMKQLKHLGAVNVADSTLSETGIKMARLPLEPRLSYLILIGIENGVGFESVIIASLATVSRNIFFRNSDNQKEADAKKIRFCQSESDFLTFFEIYKEWSEVPKAGKSRWCVSNCINAKSMRIAHDLVNELLQTLLREIDIKVTTKFSTDNILSELINIIFLSFSENLSVYSGHNKYGYRSPTISDPLHIHPSSSLCSFGSWKPEYIVYDSILQTSQSFLINITYISKNGIEIAIQKSKLSIDLKEYEKLILKPYVFTSLSDVIMKRLLGKNGKKLKELEITASDIAGGSCALNMDFQKGELSLYDPVSLNVSVKGFIFSHILEIKDDLFNAEETLSNFIDIPGLDAIFGNGAEVKEIILPGEYRSIKVILTEKEDLPLVVNRLQKCGTINYVRESNKYNKITFSKVSSARKAVKEFVNENTFTVKAILNECNDRSAVPLFKLLIEILRRPCTGLAFFCVDPPAQYPEVIFSMQHRLLYYKEHLLKISKSSKNESDICIHGLPKDVKLVELRNFLNSNMPENIKVGKLVIVRTKEFNPPDEAKSIKSYILQEFTMYTSEKKVHLEMRKPKPKDTYWNAIAYFDNPYDGQIAVNALNGRMFNFLLVNSPLVLKPVLETSLFCRKEIFVALKTEIEQALKFYNKGASKSDNLSVEAAFKGEYNVILKIVSNNINDMNDARKCLSKFIQGDSIICNTNPLLEKLFTEKGKSFLRNLQQQVSESYIHINASSKVISVFGNESSCALIKTEINKFLDKIEKDNFAEIALKSEKYPKGLLKILIQKYNYDLKELQVICNLSTIEVNIYRHVLTVSGSTESINQCQKIIDDLSTDLRKDVEKEETIVMNECSVCYDEATQPYRLAYCGHVYCKNCVFFQFKSVDSSFPLICCKEDCHKPLVIEDIQWALKQKPDLKNKIYSKAFDTFVKQNEDVKFCPTPNCPSVYRVATDGDSSEYTCSACSNNICTRCGVLYHLGMSCDLYKLYKTDDDYSLKVWFEADPENRKQCPKCSSPIEKNGGCTHMTCWKCKCHMCWRCLSVFSTGNEVYMHQPMCKM